MIFAAQSLDNCYLAYCAYLVSVSLIAFWSVSIWNERSSVVRVLLLILSDRGLFLLLSRCKLFSCYSE